MGKVVQGEIVALFDDPKLVRLEERICDHRTNAINEILETGKLLALAHEVLAEKGKHSKFGKWVSERCDFSKKTALRYIKAYSLFGDHTSISGHISISAVEYLAGDVPEEAPLKAIEEAKKGGLIYLPRAKDIVKEVTPSSDPCGSGSTDEETTSVIGTGLSQLKSSEDEPEEEYEEDLSAEELLKDHNSLIESYCRAVMKLVTTTRPDVHWLDHKGRWDGALRKIKQGLDTIRSAKAIICPQCGGDGCDTCQQIGYLPKIEAESTGA